MDQTNSSLPSAAPGGKSVRGAADREARVEALRRAYLDGTLDLTIPEDSSGFDRLLDDLGGGVGTPRKGGGV